MRNAFTSKHFRSKATYWMELHTIYNGVAPIWRIIDPSGRYLKEDMNLYQGPFLAIVPCGLQGPLRGVKGLEALQKRISSLFSNDVVPEINRMDKTNVDEEINPDSEGSSLALQNRLLREVSQSISIETCLDMITG